ncbi:MAG TPA: hypothetical protein VMU04_00650 [Candidatus Acidoferrum sp.]|nr:hypothetical protein [Candidatus Acidoferrum sp.]
MPAHAQAPARRVFFRDNGLVHRVGLQGKHLRAGRAAETACVRRSTVGQMEAALQGDWREELLFVLPQSRAACAFFQSQLASLDEKIIASNRRRKSSQLGNKMH